MTLFEGPEEPTGLQVVWLPTVPPLPLYVGERTEALAAAQAAGYPVFFLLASYREKYEENKVTKWRPAVPKVFKVTVNDAVEGVATVEEGSLNLPEVNEVAWMKLPKIPFLLVQKIDAFFRLVDDKFRTEAIVILTFDRRYLPHDPDGWGFVVPLQTNSGGHCDYKPESVVDMIPEDDLPYVIEVGTAHSHPDMGAFASHTDHGDQDKAPDGIHITFGWGPGRPTQHWVELQVGAQNYHLDPKHAFADAPGPPTFPELDPLVANVSKKAVYAAGFPTTGAGATWTGDNRPAGCPDPATTAVVAVMGEYTTSCPVCYTWVTNDLKAYRRCRTCGSYLAYEAETVEDIIAVRDKLSGDSNPPAASTDELRGLTAKAVVVFEKLKTGGVSTRLIHSGTATASTITVEEAGKG